ncbi:MAG: 5-(carboxyamino)imidazole ribonucleotide mutase [Kiritimatiellae bacterium]|nr:5-(carboxyamino)imidazole ribonucleotide mutase [Kiritimatiellia bacterium]
MSKKQPAPAVGLVMGSDSDWPLVSKAHETLDELGIPHEVRVMSAHRSPDIAHDYAAAAEGRGLKVILAAAGGAAHLAGVLAAWTTLPVIGIPVPGGALGGLEALLATVQMPSGIPVATVALSSAGPANAAVLAAEILALSDAGLRKRLRERRRKLRDKVVAADAALQDRL